MGATLECEGNLRIVRLSGELRKAELDAIQWGEAGRVHEGEKTRVLVIAEDFSGWRRADEWGDVQFVMTHGDSIEKMALVANPEWEAQLLMFTGAGFRRTQIRFFPLGQIEAARAWLAEQIELPRQAGQSKRKVD